MRALTFVFLCLAFTGTAFAQLKPLNPPPSAPASAPAAATSPKGPGQLNAQGKVQIGYDKRADYPTIKQPMSGSAAKPAEPNALTPPTAANAQNPQNLNGNIQNPSQAQRKNTLPTAANFVAGATATSTAATTPPKPRSDSALRSDSSPAREAAATAQAQAAAKAAADKKQADALGAAIAAAQKAGALPIKPQ